MPEENKGLNLNQIGSTPPPVAQNTENPPQTPPDANAAPKPDNADQTAALTQTQNGGQADTSPALDEAAAIRAVDAVGVTGAGEGEVIYSSHPIGSYKLGRFQFENSILRLTDPKDKADFEKILDALQPRDRNRIRTISLDKVDEIVSQRQQVLATRQFDSSVGRDALDALRGAVPTVGREDVTHAATPQTDNNIPLVPNAPIDNEGISGLDQGPHTAPGAGQ